MTSDMEKAEIRKGVLQIRKSLSKNDIEEMSRIIVEKIFNSDCYKNSCNIAVYLDFNNEVKTGDLIKKCLKDKKRVYAPSIIKNDKKNIMIMTEIFDTEKDLEPGPYGIMQPKNSEKLNIDPKLPDLVIIPGVAFDDALNRVGYGGGFYDKFLKQLSPYCKKVAVCFDIQIVKKIPCETHDIKMDTIITEKRILK